MITLKMNEEDVLDMLVNRVIEMWTTDSDIIELFRRMYEEYVYGGVFESMEFDPMVIVDNDYVNNCNVLSPGEDYYDEIKAIYDEQGLGDCSREIDAYSYIEAEYNGLFLVRG